jgi:hypothetical protein
MSYRTIFFWCCSTPMFSMLGRRKALSILSEGKGDTARWRTQATAGTPMFRHEECDQSSGLVEESAKVAEIAKVCSTLVSGFTSGVPFANTPVPLQERKSAKR